MRTLEAKNVEVRIGGWTSDSSATPVSFSGNATVLFGGSPNNALINYIDGGTLTFASTTLFHGYAGAIFNHFSGGNLDNQGTISADAAGGSLFVGGLGTTQNEGTLSASNGGTLGLEGSWTKSGAITSDATNA